ncbi:MAG: four helix bundle protein [Bacteroidota bacterium]|nr:four helix bundle protein [Bacteroidota bacterium]
MAYRGFRDLKVFQLSYRLGLEIFELTKSFPKEELYSLTDQIRRLSRSVPANIAEAWRKRKYPKHFVGKFTDCLAEESETEVWLDYSKDLKYLGEEKYDYFLSQYDEVARMLVSMIDNPNKFCH